MRVVESGSLSIRRGETLSLFAGPCELMFVTGKLPTGNKPNEFTYSVPFDLEPVQSVAMWGTLVNGTSRYTHRTVFTGTAEPDMTLATYMIIEQGELGE